MRSLSNTNGWCKSQWHRSCFFKYFYGIWTKFKNLTLIIYISTTLLSQWGERYLNRAQARFKLAKFTSECRFSMKCLCTFFSMGIILQDTLASWIFSSSLCLYSFVFLSLFCSLVRAEECTAYSDRKARVSYCFLQTFPYRITALRFLGLFTLAMRESECDAPTLMFWVDNKKGRFHFRIRSERTDPTLSQ